MKYFILENQKIKELSPADLFVWYRDRGLVKTSDIKYVGWFRDEFVQKRRKLGDNVFLKREDVVNKTIIALRGEVKIFEGDSIEDAIEFCKANKYSSASNGVIQSTILRNLEGKTKAGYGLTWRIESDLL